MKQSKWFIFVLVAIAQFMVVLDNVITNVALPSIKQQLHFSEGALQWVVTAYALTFGGFLLFGGRAADLFGRRRVLMAGMTAFAIFSFLIGVSHPASLLIVLRALQGMSAAFMSPAALSIVLTTFSEGPERNRALAYWTLVATAGGAVGLLLGGILTQYIGWRWDFFVNVPVGLIMLAMLAKFVPKHAREDVYTGLDTIGAILITSSLMLLVFAFSQASAWGWVSGRSLGTIAASLALLAAFAYNEARLAKHPLVPLAIFKIRNVAGANLMIAPVYGIMLSVLFIVTLYTQIVLHFTPVQTGLAFLPFPIILGFTSTRVPKLVARYGFKRWLVIGPSLVALGLAWLSRMPVNGHYLLTLLPVMMIMPIGMGLTFMPIFAAATSGVPARESGLASGLITTSQMMGGALGLAVLSSVAASATASAGYLGKQGALVHGFDRAMLVGIAFMVFAVALAILVIHQRNNKPKAPQPNEAKENRAEALHTAIDS